MNGGNFPLPQSTKADLEKKNSRTHVLVAIKHFLSPPSILFRHHRYPLSPSLSGLGWLGVTQMHWTLVFNVYRSLTLASVAWFLDPIVCARLGTLGKGLRTIPFGYLRSTNRAQMFRVSVSTGFVEIGVSNDRESLCSTCNPWVSWIFFFVFHLLPNSHSFHLQVFITRNLDNDMVL
jgi:hypothetical protein